jgi:hypothetical protein
VGIDPAREAALREDHHPVACGGGHGTVCAAERKAWSCPVGEALALLDAERAEAERLRLTLEAIGAELRARYEQSERDDSELRGAVWGLLASVRAALDAAPAAESVGGG